MAPAIKDKELQKRQSEKAKCEALRSFWKISNVGLVRDRYNLKVNGEKNNIKRLVNVQKPKEFIDIPCIKPSADHTTNLISFTGQKYVRALEVA